jgi:hypothetical protein
MKSAVATFVLATLLIAPIACLIVACPVVDTHDCCPKSKTFAACPFDILAAAKSALPAVAGIVLSSVPMHVAQRTADAVRPVVSDHRDLHLQIRVLRI